MTDGQNTGAGGTTGGSSRSIHNGGPARQGDATTRDAGARDASAKAADTISKITQTAQEAGQQARQAAASMASNVGDKAKHLMNEQVGAGAEMAAQIAQSIRIAAENLSSSAPLLAGLARLGADQAEEFSETLRDQTVEEMLAAASDFARRRPAVVFGAAAACGFVLFRLLKAAPSGVTHRGPQRRAGEEWPLQPRGNEWSDRRSDAERAMRPSSGGAEREHFNGT